MLNFTIYTAIFLNYFRIPDYILPIKNRPNYWLHTTHCDGEVGRQYTTDAPCLFKWGESHSGSELAPLMSVDSCVENLQTFGGANSPISQYM